MQKKIILFITIFITLFTLDQYIKMLFVNGFGIEGNCISLVLTYNKGVAFSMFAFLEENLKFIQIAMLLAGIIYLFSNKNIFNHYYIPAAILISGGVSNIYDRFIHEGVVDYVYWHCGFNFAIFNFADVLIDIAVVLMIYINYKNEKEETRLA